MGIAYTHIGSGPGTQVRGSQGMDAASGRARVRRDLPPHGKTRCTDSETLRCEGLPYRMHACFPKNGWLSHVDILGASHRIHTHALQLKYSKSISQPCCCPCGLFVNRLLSTCLLYTSPSPRDAHES
eukprot:4449178-Prymnesium_polylepis.1